MEPRIQYAKTKDGVSIAFWTLGDGEPLLHAPPGTFSNIQLEWQAADNRAWFERLAKRRTVIRLDPRGAGLSDREIDDITPASTILDIEAVVNRLGLKRFTLLGLQHSGPVAIAYAALHPDQVSHLILWCTWARGADILSPQLRGMGRLMDTNWELYAETVAHAFLGWSEGDKAHRFADLVRESSTKEIARTALQMTLNSDVTSLLPRVKAPALILHRRDVAFPDLAVARKLASQIPDARLALLEGASLAPWLGDTASVLSAIQEFLGDVEEAAASEPPEVGAFRTILFTDVEGSTALTDRLGDAKAREVLREHESMVREALTAHGGSEVKTMGDGFMASFGSASKALECAIAMQRSFAEHNESADEPILVRVGLNAGEPIAEDEDLFGTAVIEAARITAIAKGGEILVANVVRELAKGKDFLFADRGETSLRGFEDPVRLFEVRWQE